MEKTEALQIMQVAAALTAAEQKYGQTSADLRKTFEGWVTVVIEEMNTLTLSSERQRRRSTDVVC